MIDTILEERWCEEKNKSVSDLVSLIKKSPSIIEKYNFDKIQSKIISKLLKSNDKFWYDIEEGTMNGRKRRVEIKDIETKIISLADKITEERVKENPHQEMIKIWMDDIEYIRENYDPETKTLVTYEDVNKNYDDIELIFFFVQYAETIDEFIKNTVDLDGSFDEETLFVEYITKLFAFTLNGIGIEFKDNEIVLKIVVADEDMAAVMKMND